MYEVAKRAIDVVAALALLVLFAPLWAGAAIMIKATTRGPILYRGVRVGRNGGAFRLLKFRTMVADADKIGGSSTASDDPRVTRVGQLLRHYKIDELPNLINVLRGDMSLVGPRPQVSHDVALYTESERRLLTVKPGITDFASIQFRNEGELLAGHADPDQAYTELIRPDKIRLGLLYVQRRSLQTDLAILVDTVRAIVGFPVRAWWEEPQNGESA